MSNYDFIIEYKKLKSISNICEELGINYSNLINNKTTDENEKKVASLLKKQIIEMYDLILFDKIFEEIEQNGEKTDIL